MKTFPAALALLGLLAACGPGAGHDGGWSQGGEEEIALPVRVAPPQRADVEDYVESQATLESDRRADVYAEIEGQVMRRLRDVGDRVGDEGDREDPLLLATLDDRDRRLSLEDARIHLEETRGRVRELELEQRRAERELEQARVALEEADARHARTTEGIRDGTISIEEHEKATFARNLARTKVLASEAALEKSKVALELGRVEVEQADVARQRAELDLEKAELRAPFPGVVTECRVREGERVRPGDLLYRVEDPATLVLYADLPVRQTARVRTGNRVRLTSNAVSEATAGEVVMVAPTVASETGTVRVKVRVDPAPGYKPGLFVTLQIVVDTRARALVVPKRSVLHDEEKGPYLFTVEKGCAVRLAVRTGYTSGAWLEIAEGLDEGAQVVVEGQDTLTDGAAVEIQAE